MNFQKCLIRKLPIQHKVQTIYGISYAIIDEILCATGKPDIYEVFIIQIGDQFRSAYNPLNSNLKENKPSNGFYTP